MQPQVSGRLKQEVDLIQRFTETYRRKVSYMIDRMNHGGSAATNAAGLRLCVEAVDMMLASQKQLCKTLSELAGNN